MLVQDIREAELVLVGIGSEMQVRLRDLKEIPDFREKLSILEKKQDKEWVIPFLIRYFLRGEYHQKIVKAYESLGRLLEGKNYFIVSLSTDDLIRKVTWKEEKVVLPCGTYEILQCAENCSGRLFGIEELFWNRICGWIEGRVSLEELEEPKCPDCGASLVMNQYGQPKYNESGYLENWKRYTKWLQGTVNRKLCILELGVGMELPTIIRWPFEKICFYNRKCTFWRVHSSLYQLSEEIKAQGTSVKSDPLTFLGEL